MKFRLTFQVVTEESAQHGDFARHGFLTREGELPATRKRAYLPKNPALFPLRRAVEILLDRQGEGPVEADSCPISLQCPPRWFNYGGGWNKDRESVTIGLHLPDSISPSSALRIARILKCYGIR